MKTFFLFLFSLFPFIAHSQLSCNEYKLSVYGTSWHSTKSAAFVAGWPKTVTTWNSCGQFKTTDIGVEHRETTNKCYYKREVSIITAGNGCTSPTTEAFGLIEAQCSFTSRLASVPTVTQDIPLGYYPLQDTNDPNYSTSPVGDSITTSGASAAAGSYCVGGRQASVIDLIGVEQNTSSWVTSSGGIKLYQVFLKAEMQPICISCTPSDSEIPTSSTPPAGSTPNAPGIDAPNGVRPPGCEGYDICLDGTSDGGPDGDGTTGGTGGTGDGTGGTGDGTGGTGDGTGGTGDGTGGTGDGTGGTGDGTGGTGGTGTSPEGEDCPECAKESTQQANKTLLESIKDFLTGEGTAPNVPESKTKENFESELLNSDSPAFSSLLSWRLPSHQSACPQPSFQAFGTVFQFTAHCDLITDNFGILRSVFITIFSVSAIFIVLKA